MLAMTGAGNMTACLQMVHAMTLPTPTVRGNQSYLLAEDAEAEPKPEDKPSEDKRQPIKALLRKRQRFSGKKNSQMAPFARLIHPLALLNCPRQLDWKRAKPRSYDEWKEKTPFRADCLVPPRRALRSKGRGMGASRS